MPPQFDVSDHQAAANLILNMAAIIAQTSRNDRIIFDLQGVDYQDLSDYNLDKVARAVAEYFG